VWSFCKGDIEQEILTMNGKFPNRGLTVSLTEDGHDVCTFHIGSSDHGVGGGHISGFNDISHDLDLEILK
jgi:hypothetical protein